jgi:hypothetical protein
MAAGLADGHGMGAPRHVPAVALLLQPALVLRAQVPSRTHAGVHTLPGHCQDKAPAWRYLGPHEVEASKMFRLLPCSFNLPWSSGLKYPPGAMQGYTPCPDTVKIKHLLGAI